MKRTVTILLLLLLVFSLCACGVKKTADLQAEEPQPTAVEAAQEPVIEAIPEPTPTPEPTPEPTPTPPPLPDIDVNSWEFLLANSFNSIGMEYAPEYGYLEGQGIEARCADAAMAFLTAAREAGYQAYVSTAYRNSEFLNTYYLGAFHNTYGGDAIETANHFLAQGIDEHQTGLAIDFTEWASYNAYYGIFEDEEMRYTDLYNWAVEHCADYGFILRYPEGKEEYYGVACRHPAHFRYVGEEAAHYIMDNDLCLEEFLLMYEGNNVYMPKP